MKIIKYAILLFLLLSTALACQKKNPRVEIQTPKGKMIVELDVVHAPVTAGNFMKLVENGVYDGSSFYRSVRNASDRNPIPIAVVQGGVMRNEQRVTWPSINHEHTDMTGISHLHGVISMARRDTGSASTEFFICVGDNVELDYRGRRNPDGQGFTAFGRLVEGDKVLHDIWGSSAAGENLDPKIRIHKMKLIK